MSVLKLQNEMKRWKAITIACLLWNLYITGTGFEELIQMLRSRAKTHEDYGVLISNLSKKTTELEDNIKSNDMKIWIRLNHEGEHELKGN